MTGTVGTERHTDAACDTSATSGGARAAVEVPRAVVGSAGEEASTDLLVAAADPPGSNTEASTNQLPRPLGYLPCLLHVGRCGGQGAGVFCPPPSRLFIFTGEGADGVTDQHVGAVAAPRAAEELGAAAACAALSLALSMLQVDPSGLRGMAQRVC